MTTATKAVSTTQSKSSEHSGPARKLLSFGLGREEYGLDILAVREIIGVIDITPLPRTPMYVKGVINLRGKIIPVIELRARFDRWLTTSHANSISTTRLSKTDLCPSNPASALSRRFADDSEYSWCPDAAEIRTATLLFALRLARLAIPQ